MLRGRDDRLWSQRRRWQRTCWPLLSGVSLSVLASLASAGWRPTHALVINDIAAAAAGGIDNYWDKDNVFANVVSIADPGGKTYCTGTLVNARTIVTASHCLVLSGSHLGSYVADTEIRFSPQAKKPHSNDRGLSGAAAMPGYTASVFANNDFAVLSLDRPVTEIAPSAYMNGTEPWFDYAALAVIAGYGQNGTGTNPPDRYVDPIDGKRRVGETLLTDLGTGYSENPDFPTYTGLFRDPLNPDAVGAKGVSMPGVPVPYYQAGTAPGDSGGPLFLVTDEGLILIGTLVGGYSTGPDGWAGYGFLNVWTPLFMVHDWFASVNPLREVSALAGDHVWSDAEAWHDPHGPGEVPNNRAGDFSGSGMVGRYWNVTLSEAGSMMLDMSAQVDSVTVSGSAATLDIAAPFTLQTVLDFSQEAGTTRLSGTLESNRVGLYGGLFTGSGKIVAARGVLNDGATLAPGSSSAPGTLAVEGDYTQTGSGTLAVRSLGGTSDRLAVSGTASLDGTLALYTPGTVTPGVADTVLTAESGVQGRFASIVPDREFVFLYPEVSYEGTSVSVAYQRNEIPLATFALTRNEAGVARAIDTLPLNNPVSLAFMQSGADETPRALGGFTGEVHTSALTTLMYQSALLRSAVGNRLRQGLGKDAVPAGADMDVRPLAVQQESVARSTSAWNGLAQAGSSSAGAGIPESAETLALTTWLQGVGAWGNISSSPEASRLTSNVGGAFAGIDATYRQDWRLGIALGYTASDFSISGVDSSGSTSDYHLALYGSAFAGPVAVRLGGGYTWTSIDTSRSVVIPGFADMLSSSSDARTGQVFAEFAYPTSLPVTKGSIAIEPFAGIAYVNVSADAFSERGGAAALYGASSSYSSTFSTLGMRFNVPVAIEEARSVFLRGELGWRHAFGDLTPTQTLSFLSGSSPFSVEGLPIARNALVVEAGIEMEIQERMGLSVVYDGDLATDAQSHAVKGRFSLTF